MQSGHDPCLFTWVNGSSFLALLVYVDDVLITGSSDHDITQVKRFLHEQFTIKDIGPAKSFLGVEIARSKAGIYINQRKYILDIIQQAGLTGSKPTATPFPKGLKLNAEDGTLLSNPESYRRMVGQLLYLGFTRPDITYAVQQLSQFVQHPTDLHWNAALHVLKYLKNCPSKGPLQTIPLLLKPIVMLTELPYQKS